jgi:hypothetical protein
VSYANPTAQASDFHETDRVAYIEFDGSRAWGTVSSVNQSFVFVRFDKNVGNLGWAGATSQSCDPRDLIKESAK